MPAAIPAGFIDIDDLVELEERDPLKAAAIAEGRRTVAERLYGAEAPTLSFYRLRKGWSQKQLADKVNTSQPYIARLEAGGVDPQVSTLRRVAAALEVSLAELLEALPERS